MSFFKEFANFARQLSHGFSYAVEAVKQGDLTPEYERPRGGTAPVAANQPLTIQTSAPKSRESINFTQGRNESARAGALLGGGDAGLQLDPLGRRGSGGVGRTSMLGR